MHELEQELSRLGQYQELDARGLSCPMPLLKAKQSLNAMAAGELLKVMATDPGSVRDFASFAELSGHKLVYTGEESGVFIYVLKKHG